MAFYSSTSNVVAVDAQLTKTGRSLLLNEGMLSVSRFRLFDTEINYNLITAQDADSSNPNIDILPLIELTPRDTSSEYSLSIDSSATSGIGIIVSVPVSQSNIKLLSGNTLIDNPQYFKGADVQLPWNPIQPPTPNPPVTIQAYTITVNVVDPTLSPVSNARVVVYKENLSNSLSSVVNTDVNGNAVFQNLQPNKAYYIVPSLDQYTFLFPRNVALLSPGSKQQNFAVINSLSGNLNVFFTASANVIAPSSTFTISGTVTNGVSHSGLSGVLITLSNQSSITSSSAGTWSFTGLSGNKAYTVFFGNDGYIFNPPATAVGVLLANTVLNTTATPVFNIFGKVISDVDGYLNNALITLTNNLTGSVVTQTSSQGLGDFSFHSLVYGNTYKLLGSLDSYLFRNTPYTISSITSSLSGINLSASKILPITPISDFPYPPRNKNNSPIIGVHCENSWYFFSKKWATIDYYVVFEPANSGIPHVDIVRSTDNQQLINYYLRGNYVFNFWTKLKLQDTPVPVYQQKINDSYVVELTIWRRPYSLTLTTTQFDLTVPDTVSIRPPLVNNTLSAQVGSVAVVQGATTTNSLNSLNVNNIAVANNAIPQASVVQITPNNFDFYSNAFIADDLDVNMIGINMIMPSDPAQRKFNSTSPDGFWFKQDFVVQDNILVGETSVKTPVDTIVNNQVQTTQQFTAELLPPLVFQQLWDNYYLKNNLKPIPLNTLLSQVTNLDVSEVVWQAPASNNTQYTFGGFLQTVATIDPQLKNIVSINSQWWLSKFQKVPTNFYQVLEAVENLRYGNATFSSDVNTAIQHVQVLYDSTLNVSKISNTVAQAGVSTVALASASQASVNSSVVAATPNTNQTSQLSSVSTQQSLINNPLGAVGANTNAILSSASVASPSVASPNSSQASVQTGGGSNVSVSQNAVSALASTQASSVQATNSFLLTLNQSLVNVASNIKNISPGISTNILGTKTVSVNQFVNTPQTVTNFAISTVPQYQTITRAVKSEIDITNYNNYIYAPINAGTLSSNANVYFKLNWNLTNSTYTPFWNKIFEENANRQYVHYLRVRLRDISSQTTSINQTKITSAPEFSASALPNIFTGDEICFIIPITGGGVIDTSIIPSSSQNKLIINNSSVKSYGRWTDKSPLVDSNGLPRTVANAQKEYLYVRIVDVGAIQDIVLNAMTIRADIVYKLTDSTLPLTDPLNLSRFFKILQTYTQAKYEQDITDLQKFLNNLNEANDPKKGLWVGSFFGDPTATVNTPPLWNTNPYLPNWTGKFNDMLSKISILFPTIVDITSGNSVQNITQLIQAVSTSNVSTQAQVGTSNSVGA